MSKQARRRSTVSVVASALATFALGLAAAVFVAGSATASPPVPTTPPGSSTTSSTTPDMGSMTGGFDPNSPQAQFLVINGTIAATSDHEIVGSSAFPNFTTGAVDNYYTMSRSHLDNSPFSEATASPFDTGPIGQTAAAGNFQQPQYADARWPGGPETMTYGSKGQPFAEAGADEIVAKADAAQPSNGLSGPGLGGSKTLAVPKGFDQKLQQTLGSWKTKYLNCPAPPKKTPLPKVSTPKPPKPPVPTGKVTTPTVTVKTPLGTVTTAHAGAAPPAPSVAVPTPAAPTAAPSAPRSLSSVPAAPCSSASSGSDGESLLTSSTLGILLPGTADTNKDIDKVKVPKIETTSTQTTTTEQTTTGTPQAWKPKPYTVLMGGESSLGRVTIGHGAIVIQGVHVTASLANDGTAKPSYKTSISVASATIGGVPVTIDESGVHVAGHGQGLPYKQASDSLNTALKQAGIQIFLAAPQVTDCTPNNTGTGTTTTETTTTTDTTTTDQSGAASPCAQGAAPPMCGAGGMDSGTGTDTTTTSSTPAPAPAPTPTDQTDTTSAPPSSSCPPPDSCGASGTGGYGGSTTTGSTTTTTSTPTPNPTATQSTTTTQTDTTSSTSSFCPSEPPPPTSGCATAGAAPAPTSTGSTTTTSTDSTMMGGSSTGQETIVMATGVHVVFTQPVNQSGVPAQFAEHILGEVFIDSLAAPATPLPALGPLGSAGGGFSSCKGGKGSGTKLTSSGGSSAGGGGGLSSSGASSGVAGASGSLSSSGSGLGSSSGTEGTAGSGGGSLPAMFATALRKPLWLLLAYVIWQALVIGTGASLWHWRRGGA